MDTQTTEERPTQASADLHASIDLVQGQLVEFDKISAGLAAIEQAHPKDVACNVSTVAGMKQAIAGRAAWREPRIALEKARKAAKAPVLALGRDIDTFARSLETKLLEGEAHYDDQIKAEEARKEAERAEKLRKEAERVEAIHRRIHEVFVSVPSMMDGSTSAELLDEIKRIVAIEIDAAVFQEQAGAAALAKDAALSVLRRMQEKAAAREAEETRLAAERAELERQRAEQARIEADARKARDEEAARLRQEREALAAQQAAARAEQKRLDDEARARRLQEETEARAAREKADREDRARRDEEDRRAREARAAEDKRIATERAALEAAQKQAREAQERQQAEARRIEQELADAEVAEKRRLEEEDIANRRRTEEAKHQADIRVRGAAHLMLETLQRWQRAEKPADKVALQQARVMRDQILAELA